jgi:uncharacterized cofD-like protein
MSTSRGTLPKQSQSNRAIVVLGGGRGLAAVLRALRDADYDLTVIVSIAYAEEQAAGPEQRMTAETVEDLRRSLETLTGEEDPLLRAIRRPLSIERLGRQPLGNLVLASVASAFGDYGAASVWLGEQLGIAGAVLPATTQPLPRQIETAEEASTSGRAGAGQVRRLSFAGDAVTPEPALTAIARAQWVLVAPGPLYESVLSTAAVPDVAASLARTRARVLWIANLQAGSGESADMTAIDHLRVLTLHGVRVDGVLHDPSAPLRFDVSELEGEGVESIARPLRADGESGGHDPERLRAALEELIGSSATAIPPGRVSRR